jgi:hypothetical protein
VGPIKPGMRFRSAVCSVEVIIITAPPAELDLRCGGAQMLPIAQAGGGADNKPPKPGFGGGTQLGKRYIYEAGSLELLCTKPGPSSLSVGEVLLDVKEAKPLPSSD